MTTAHVITCSRSQESGDEAGAAVVAGHSHLLVGLLVMTMFVEVVNGLLCAWLDRGDVDIAVAQTGSRRAGSSVRDDNFVHADRKAGGADAGWSAARAGSNAGGTGAQ